MSSSKPVESRVIKRLGKPQSGDRVMTARAAAGEPEVENFQSFESLWEDAGAMGSDGPEYDALRDLQAEQERLRLECEELVRNAEARAVQIEQEAYERGFAKGEAEALALGAKGEAERQRAVDGVLAAIQGQRAELDAIYERDLLLLTKSLVNRLVYHEVSVNPLVIQACLKKAMEYVVENSTVKVRLHPDDFIRIKDASLENPALLEGKCALQLIEDPLISQGGCYLETDFGEVDATMEQRRTTLDRVVENSFLVALADKG